MGVGAFWPEERFPRVAAGDAVVRGPATLGEGRAAGEGTAASCRAFGPLGSLEKTLPFLEGRRQTDAVRSALGRQVEALASSGPDDPQGAFWIYNPSAGTLQIVGKREGF